MIKQTITTKINHIATSSRSLSEFRSKVKSEAGKLKPSLVRTDLFRVRLTNEMWETFKNTNYIDYPDKAVIVIMEEFMKAELCK